MKGDVTLRKIKADDREEFFAMSRDFYVCGAAHATIPEENRLNFWNEVLSGEFINGYIIECDDEVAGYALIAYYASQEFGGKTAFFDELYIKPAMRRRGIGKKKAIPRVRLRRIRLYSNVKKIQIKINLRINK